jgi:hypothetical protein
MRWYLLLVAVVSLVILGTPAPDRAHVFLSLMLQLAVMLMVLSAAFSVYDGRQSRCAVCHRGWAVFHGPRPEFSERRCRRHRVRRQVQA